MKALRLYSLQRRRERYCIILIWKIIESKAQNLSDPILCNFSDRRGRSCVISHVNTGRQGTLAYNNFRWRAIHLFNSLPKSIRDTTNCSVCSFKQRLDRYLNSIPDLPCTPGYNNSLDGGDCLQRWTLRDDLFIFFFFLNSFSSIFKKIYIFSLGGGGVHHLVNSPPLKKLQLHKIITHAPPPPPPQRPFSSFFFFFLSFLIFFWGGGTTWPTHPLSNIIHNPPPPPQTSIFIFFFFLNSFPSTHPL